MFASFVFEKASAEYTEKILLIDSDNLNGELCYSDYFAAQGFSVLRYENDLLFRIEHDEAIYGEGRYAVIAPPNIYIPYDVRRRFRVFDVSIASGVTSFSSFLSFLAVAVAVGLLSSMNLFMILTSRAPVTRHAP